MLNHYLEFYSFQRTIEKLTFKYCIPISTLCDLSYRKEFFDAYGYEDSGDMPNEECINQAKRYSRLLKRLCVEDLSETEADSPLEHTKIYDEFLLERQIELYNDSAKMVGYLPIEAMVPMHLLKQYSYREDVIEHYPYYPGDKREGTSLIECILLVNMCLTIHDRSLYTVNKEAKTDADKQRVKTMVDKLMQSINSEQMYRLCVHVFFDVFERVVHEFHREKAEKSIRLAWLPENLKDRKDAFAAFERYKNRFFKNRPKDYGEWHTHYSMVSQNSVNSEETAQSVYDFAIIDHIESDILPLVFYILMGETGEEYVSDSPKENELAQEYAQIIKNYINKAIDEAKNLINDLYIKNL